MNPQLNRLLDHLAATLDPARQAAIDDLHRRALSWEPVERLPLVVSHPVPQDAPFPPYPHSDTFDDPEKMLYNELTCGFNTSIASRNRLGDDLACTVRADFGTVLVASVFGVRVEQVEENPPWARPFGSMEEFRAILDQDPLDVNRGWVPRVVETYRRYHAILDAYPDLRDQIKIVLPDLQGPLDTVELLRGCALYTDVYSDPVMVCRALDSVARAQVALAGELAPYVTDGPEGFAHQHVVMICGRILIRDDSAILVSPQMYRDFVAPHDELVLREMGGGGIHCCGCMDRHAAELLALPSIRCIDLGQPEMNDIDAVYAMARERRVALVRLSVAEEELTSGSVMERFPTGVSLAHAAASLQDAARIFDAYRDATEGK